MTLKTEIVEDTQSILILSKINYSFLDILKAELKNYGSTVYTSTRLTAKLKEFDYCFVINETGVLERVSTLPKKKIILIFFNEKGMYEKQLRHTHKHVKIVNIEGGEPKKEDVDRILWFSLSQSQETNLNIKLLTPRKFISTSYQGFAFDFRKIFSRKRVIILLLLLFLLLQIAFLPPLILSSALFYESERSLSHQNLSSSNKYLDIGTFFFNQAKFLYSFARPTYLFLSIAIIPDNLMDINDKARAGIADSQTLYSNAEEIFKLVLDKNKTADETTALTLRLNILNGQIAAIDQDLTALTQKIPDNIGFLKPVRDKLAAADDLVVKVKKISPFIPQILGKDGKKQYLLLFANNMELRPGGGFIGSFGTITFNNLTLQDLQIYDVYDADGQLLAHIDPPAPIKTYLNQPHWFLRDSAFSPDFFDNYTEAKFFLDKEMHFENFSGGVLITTTAIQNILKAFGNVSIPDFNEMVNAQNFYLKAEVYSEKNFFPGSIQKKSFLGSLTRQLLIALGDPSTFSLPSLAQNLKNSFDDKQFVVYFDNPQIQNSIDSFYWSGRLIQPKCVESENCISDYLFPIDANLGVNKANFFVTRSMDLKVYIGKDGTINHYLSIDFRNDSPGNVFPGGTYKNYFQLMLPQNATVKTVTKDGTLVENLDETDEPLKTVGFLLEVKPQTTSEIKIEYSLGQKLVMNKNVYQLIFQKQIGSSDSDITLEFSLPKNVYPVNQNFSPLVKDNSIFYNTSLSTDKIFFLELAKK